MFKAFCDECGGRIVQNYFGELVCSCCGLTYGSVADSQLDNLRQLVKGSSEPLSYVLFSPMGSYIGKRGERILRDFQGRELPVRAQALFARLRAIQDIDPYTRQTALRHRAVRVLDKVVSFLRIDREVRDRAISRYYSYIQKEGFSRNNVLAIAASLLMASREIKGAKPLTISEICEGFELAGHKIHPRVLSKMVFKMLNAIGSKPIIVGSDHYLQKVIDKLRKDDRVIERIRANNLNEDQVFHQMLALSREFLNAVEERRKIGKNPYALATSSVYAASLVLMKRLNLGVNFLTQKLLSSISGIAEYTIREHISSLFKPVMDKLPHNGVLT